MVTRSQFYIQEVAEVGFELRSLCLENNLLNVCSEGLKLVMRWRYSNAKSFLSAKKKQKSSLTPKTKNYEKILRPKHETT